MKGLLIGLGLAIVAALAIGVIVIVATAGEGVLVLDLDAGDCFALDLDTGADDIGTVSQRDCDGPHDAEVVAVGELDPQGTVPRPADDELFATIDARCAAALVDRPDVLEQFGILPVAADERSWEPFRGRYVCVAIPYRGGTTTGSALAGATTEG